MTGFNQIERSRRTAIYIRISTSQQQTDRQETELKEFALRNGLNFNETTDMYIDIISGFKEGMNRGHMNRGKTGSVHLSGHKKHTSVIWMISHT